MVDNNVMLALSEKKGKDRKSALYRGDFGAVDNKGNPLYVAEIKYDGIRCLVEYHNDRVRIFNRRGDDITFKFPEIVKAVPESFKKDSMEVDGELVVFVDGVSEFNEGISFRTHLKDLDEIQQRSQSMPVTLNVWDILWVDGYNLTYNKERKKQFTQRDRRQILETVVMDTDRIKKAVQYKDPKTFVEVWEKEVVVKKREGLILKLLSSPYEFKRSKSWLKIKFVSDVDVVFTRYEINNAGIKLFNDDDIKVQVSGAQHNEVKREIDEKGKVTVTVTKLGGVTKNKKFRQPTFKKIVKDQDRETNLSADITIEDEDDEDDEVFHHPMDEYFVKLDTLWDEFNNMDNVEDIDGNYFITGEQLSAIKKFYDIIHNYFENRGE